MLRLDPADGPLPRDPVEALGWVDEVRIGIEVASSPYARINEDVPCVTVSDHGNNTGLLIGKQVEKTNWAKLDDVANTFDIEGKQVGKATTATMLDGPFGAVCFLLQNLVERQIKPIAGGWISSGAITGVHEIATRSVAAAHFSNIGSVIARVDAELV